MKRVLVIGCCGAGKSTFSRKLQALLKVELLHLDQYYWKPDWQEPEQAEWTAMVNDLASRPSWIMDGNYGGTMDLRIKRADTIIYLDYRTTTCLWRITKRTLKYRGRVRPDMPAGCKERFDLDFYHYVATYNLNRREGVLDKLDKVKGAKNICVLKNDAAAEAFLGKLREGEVE